MLNNIFLIKLLILLYIDWISFGVGGNIINIVIFSVIYITIIICRTTFVKKYGYVLNIFEGIITLYMGAVYEPIAILLFSIVAMEFLLFNRRKEVFALIIPLVLLGIPTEIDIISQSVTIILLVYIILRNVYKNIVKFNILVNTVEKQRKQISLMENKLKEEQSIREQFLYTTKLEEINIVTDKLNEKIGHTIAGTVLQLEAIKVMINQDSEGSKVILGRSIKNLKNGMEEMKNILRNIKPTEGELGINRLKLILEDNTKNTGVRFKVTFNGNLDLINEWQWKFFMNAVSELSINSTRYSKGDFIGVDLAVMEQYIRLEVSDNGIGVVNIIKGKGLTTLEEKVNEVEGKIILKNENGLSVVVLIPIRSIAV